MALPTFAPSLKPSPGTSLAPTIKLKKAEFGDGYTQITRDGINHMRQTLELNWEFATHEQANQIIAFLTERGGDRAFYYKPVNAAAALKWTCETWSDKIRDDGFRQLSATFIQSFTLET